MYLDVVVIIEAFIQVHPYSFNYPSSILSYTLYYLIPTTLPFHSIGVNLTYNYMDTELETLLGEQLRKTLRHMVSCASNNKSPDLGKLSQELHKGINFRKDDPSHKILTASIDLFLWFFVGFGEIWPTLFLNEKIYSTSKTVELGKHIHAFRAEMEEKGAKIPYFAELSALASREIIELIYLSSKNLVADFKKSKDILEKKVSEINSWA